MHCVMCLRGLDNDICRQSIAIRGKGIKKYLNGVYVLGQN